MPSILSVRNAARAFGSTQALAGVDLDLRKGERLALLGPNGAGKTTLVRAISGRVRLDAGDLALFETPLDGSSGEAARARERLGVVPQEIALYPLLTARENLLSFGRLLGVEGSTLGRRVDWALEWTALGDRAREPIKRFSGGMKRRLNIACSVLHKPEVILLDEPTVGVDPQSRERIWEMLEQLRRDGASFLLTTHQLDEAQQVSDRIVIIDHGKVIAAGTFEELVGQTIGAGRTVLVSLQGDFPDRLRSEFEIADGTIRHVVSEVADELPEILSKIKAAGGSVVDVQIQAPTLQAVFIHLTGRELRE